MVRVMKTVLLLIAAAACAAEPAVPPVARVWPALGTTMSAAAWGADTIAIGRALDAVRDTVARAGTAPGLDSLLREIRLKTGAAVAATTVAEGDVLDRAALTLGGVADSALLDLGGQYRWLGPRDTHRVVGIADPANSLNTIATVEMRGGSVRTLSREGGTLSVTVLAPSGVTADAWSAALLGLGCERALALGPQLRAANVSIVCGDSGRVHWSPDLEGRVQVLTRP
jgi:ApbE family